MYFLTYNNNNKNNNNTILLISVSYLVDMWPGGDHQSWGSCKPALPTEPRSASVTKKNYIKHNKVFIFHYLK